MSQPRRDVDGGWAWMVLLASFMNLLLASGIAYVAGIFQKLFLETFHQSVAYTAWVTALFYSFLQLAGPLAGWLTSVTNCRVTVMVGGALLSLGLAVSSFATSLHYLLVSFGLVGGMGLSLMYTPSVVIVNFFFDRRRTVIVGFALSASGIGITFTPMLSRFLIDRFSWQEMMMILAAIAAHVCVFGAIMFPLHEPHSPCFCCRRILSQSAALDPDCDVELGPRETMLEEGNVVQTAKKVDGELKVDGEDSAERALLCEKTISTSIADSGPLKPQLLVNNSGVDFPQDSGPTFHILGSRKSLNETSQGASGASGLPHRQLSHSAHHLDKLQKVHHIPHHLREAHSVHSLRGRGLLRGSHLDVFAISFAPSINSLRDGSLSRVEDKVTSSPQSGQDGGGDGDSGGGGSDWMVLKNVSFLLLCLNKFLSNMGIGIFNIHLPVFSQQRGVDDQEMTLVYAMFGAGLFISRILLGTLGHDAKVDQLALYFGVHFISALVEVCLPLTQNLAGVAAMTFLMGIYYGSVYSLLSSIIISIVGLPSLAFAFGMVMICSGLGFLVAPPLAGWIVDETGDYNNSMYFGGLTMLLSAITIMCLTCSRPPGSPRIGYIPQPEDTDTTFQQDHKEQPGSPE